MQAALIHPRGNHLYRSKNGKRWPDHESLLIPATDPQGEIRLWQIQDE